MPISNRLTYVLLIFGAIIFLFYTGTFTVRPDQQVLVIKFGNPQRIIQKPGLHLKIPFIEELVVYSKKAIPLDIPPKEIIMSDKSRVVVDTFSLFRIKDPLNFYRRARTLERAIILLTQQLTADLNKTIAKVNFDDMLSERRSDVMTEIVSEMRDSAAEMGVEIIDIRIRRADVPKQISDAIYQRMISERERIARRYRALGEEKAETIKAEADRQSTIIIAEAKQAAEQLRGEGDGTAAKIYADSYTRNQGFYQFYRQLKAYETSLVKTDEKPTFIVDPSQFKFLDALSRK
jgi:membrane protease subunit HflC